MRASDILYIPDSNAKRALSQTLQIAIGFATAAALYRVGY
jgi:hypothetical protein